MSKNDVVTHQALVDVASTTTKELQAQLDRKHLLRNEFREHIGRGKEGTAEMKDRVEKYKKARVPTLLVRMMTVVQVTTSTMTPRVHWDTQVS
jgi:hypothetical protein